MHGTSGQEIVQDLDRWLVIEVYLGPNAADQVMAGQFRRGRSVAIKAVIWFCDLRGFTALADRLPAADLVAMLDRYFELVSAPIEEHGGEVLKFVGDAVLAVFPCAGEPVKAAVHVGGVPGLKLTRAASARSHACR